MKNLLKYFKLVKKFIKLSLNDKSLILKVVIITAISRWQMLNVSFEKLQKKLGRYNDESYYNILEVEEINYLRKIRWAVTSVANNTPWESKCLVKAMTIQSILHRKGMETTLYLGINKDNNILVAHSWIRCGNLYITGGDGTGYAVVAKFTK